MFKAIGLSLLVFVLMGAVCFAETPVVTSVNQEQGSVTPKATHTHAKKVKKHKKVQTHTSTVKKEKKSTDQ